MINNLAVKKKAALALLAAFAALTALGAPAAARPAGAETSTASLNGYTGIWHMPSARVPADWRVRLGASYSRPYYQLGAAIGLFGRLEISTRLVGIEGQPPAVGYEGDYQDKAVDFKLVLLKETKLTPALALGGVDVNGSGVFTSRYLVMSKRFWRFDFSWGLGQGMLAGRSEAERAAISGGGANPAWAYLFSDDDKFAYFGGVELMLAPGLRLAAEYSSIDYASLRGGAPARSQVNFGLKYTLAQALTFSLAWMQGSELAAGFELSLPLTGEGLFAWPRERPPIRQEKAALAGALAEEEELARLVAQALRDDGFGSAAVVVRGEKIWAEVENNRYNEPALAVRRVFLVAENIAGPRASRYYIILSRDGVFQLGVGVGRQLMLGFLESRVDSDQFIVFSQLAQTRERLAEEFAAGGQAPAVARAGFPRLSFKLTPELTTYLYDPKGFARHDLALNLNARLEPWPGGLAVANLRLPLYNDLTASSQDKYQEPGGLGVMNYKAGERVRLDRYGLDQVVELPGAAGLRFSAGAFEAAYMGLGAEAFKFFAGGRLGLGLESQVVWLRSPKADFALDPGRTDARTTAFINIYMRLFGGSGVEAGIRAGRFLAGDWGARFEIGRSFRHFTLGAWVCVTDASGFTHPENRNYMNQGVFITIPFSLASRRPAKGGFTYTATSWLREGGQTVSQFRSLYPFGQEVESSSYLKRSLWEMRK